MGPTKYADLYAGKVSWDDPLVIKSMDDFGKFLRSLRAPKRGKPTLNYLHVLMPHGPWLYFPDGRVRAVGSPRRCAEKVP